MTKQDYELIARVLRRTARFLPDDMARALRVEFSEELGLRNGRFKPKTFLIAASPQTLCHGRPKDCERQGGCLCQNEGC